MKILEIYESFQKEMTILDTQLKKHVICENQTLQSASMQLLRAGGKRIRPALVLLGGKFGTYQFEKLEIIANSLELLHMATLVHDDVIDDAQTRRGSLTVQAKWNAQIAMYTGNFLYAKALEQISRISHAQVHDVLSRTIHQICIGEIEQIRDFYHVDQTIRRYLQRIRRKTAILLAISCQLGALVTDADYHTSCSLYRYGYNLGMAFQIQDDLLDLFGNEKITGKPKGNDLKQGNFTMPVLWGIKDPYFGSTIRTLLLHPPYNVEEVVQLIQKTPAREKTENILNRYIQKAIQATKQLPERKEREDLKEIAHFILTRTF